MSVANSQMKPTHPSETKPGLNKIFIKTVFHGFQRMLMEKDIPVTLRDGIKLYVNVFRPDKPGKFPVLISADIYGKDSSADDVYARIDNTGAIRTSPFAAWEAPDPGYWVPGDYIVIKADLRGSGKSEGALYPISPTEAQDYYELIEWAGEQDWSDGKVGMVGVSYLAMTQWYVAALNPPHLKAMIPWEGVSDMYREWAFHGGIPEYNFSGGWYKNRILCWKDREVENMPLMQKEHPLFDNYWKDRQARLSQIKVPLLVGASWSTQGLHNRGSLEGFKQAASEQKWLEIHGRKEWEYYYSRECLERQKRFFDYFLKGKDNGWPEMPKVRLEVRERFFDGLFRFENEWPLARTKYTRFYLDTQNMSLGTYLSKAESQTGYQADPKSHEKASLLFKITFEKDTELTGYMNLKLWVRADGADDMDLFAGIKKYDRRGNEVLMADYNHIENGQVATGWLRISHRELDGAKSTPWQPWHKHERQLLLTAGEIVPVEIEILPSSTLFRAGESLGLVIQGGDIITTGYRYSHPDTVNKGQHIIYTGGKYDSFLIVPVIPPKC